MGLREYAKSLLNRVHRPGGDQGKKDVQAFFESLVKQAEVWPTDEWDAAWKAYEGDPDNPPRANLWRSRVETQGAFLDEQPAHIPVSTADGWADDKQAEGRAECEEALYAYLHREMGYHEVISRVRAVADVQNMGALVHRVDMRRNLPALLAIPMEQVAVDGDSGPDIKRANWMGYWEWESAEMLIEEYPGLDATKLEAIAASAPRREDNDARFPGVSEEVVRVGKRLKVWHVFARNQYALYDKEPTEPGEPTADTDGKPHWERFRDRHGMNEPRRYVKFIAGYYEPLVDEDGWPAVLALDWDEWPIQFLRYNEGKDNVPGFTDHRHEKRIIAYHEQAIGDANKRAALGNNTKMGGVAGSPLSQAEVKTFLETDGIAYLAGAFTSDGRPTFKPIEFEGLRREDLDWIDLCKRTHEQVSGVPKIKEGSESEFDTATEAEIASEASTARANVRLRDFEAFQSNVARQVIAMAHVMVPKQSIVEVSPEVLAEAKHELMDVDTDEAGVRMWINDVEQRLKPYKPDPRFANMDLELIRHVEADNPLVPGIAAMVLQSWLALESAQLIGLGADAMVGPEKAEFWDETMPAELLRRSTVVSVERGSTQQRTRLQKVAAFNEVYDRMYAPLLASLANVDPMLAIEKQVDATRKVLGMLDLNEYESLLPDVERLKAAMLAQQEAQAAQAAAGVPQEAEVAQV